MNAHVVTTVSTSKLKNFCGVVNRIVKQDLNLWWCDNKPIIGVRLLLALYLAYQKQRNFVRNLNQNLSYNHGVIQKLEKRIKELEVFEKQIKYIGNYVVITSYHWTCEDGCCSDNWYNYALLDNNDNTIATSGTSRNSGFLTQDSCINFVVSTYGNSIKIKNVEIYFN